MEGTSMKDTAKVTFSILGAFVVIVVGIFLGVRAYDTPVSFFEDTYGMHLPARCKIISYESNIGFPGDGWKFLLIKVKHPESTIGTDLDPERFTTRKLNDYERSIITGVKNNLSPKVLLPDDTIVTFRTVHLYDDKAVIIYNKAEQTYAIYQDIS
ncbi:hypothetical protein F4555_001200 [Mobiluncus mulieris]|nr:hypothetical protein [Mobiluncus mulieris]MCU9971645.1 hypothetical protein [Mobiluncus mulieris]MCV0003344.1 hypothetical protein [Mobiluncus mulieris]MCV0012559.1 hypothetical protein [Mobiluncus mulieris]NMW91480.1 hypothetical protein [Mobiluncus mulieris]